MSLSPATLEALSAGRTIDAIKQVRKETGLGLKQAKELVDIHLAANPDLLTDRTPLSAGQKTLGFLIAGITVAVIAYQVLVKK
ncbi:MAG TPA: ribosomal protein L7/L12 [Cellvibrionaceae bacterium]